VDSQARPGKKRRLYVGLLIRKKVWLCQPLRTTGKQNVKRA
jgi:hypothetical protein